MITTVYYILNSLRRFFSTHIILKTTNLQKHEKIIKQKIVKWKQLRQTTTSRSRTNPNHFTESLSQYFKIKLPWCWWYYIHIHNIAFCLYRTPQFLVFLSRKAIIYSNAKNEHELYGINGEHQYFKVGYRSPPSRVYPRWLCFCFPFIHSTLPSKTFRGLKKWMFHTKSEK